MLNSDDTASSGRFMAMAKIPVVNRHVDRVCDIIQYLLGISIEKLYCKRSWLLVYADGLVSKIALLGH